MWRRSRLERSTPSKCAPCKKRTIHQCSLSSLSYPLPCLPLPSPPLPSPFSLTWHLSVAEEEVVERTLRNSFLVKWPRKDNSSLCRKKLIDLSLTYQKANIFFVVSLVHGTFGHKLSLHQTHYSTQNNGTCILTYPNYSLQGFNSLRDSKELCLLKNAYKTCMYMSTKLCDYSTRG